MQAGTDTATSIPGALPLDSAGTPCLDPHHAHAMLTGYVPVQAYCRKHSVQVHRAVDAGCAGGESTRWLADSHPEAQVTGVDISAHFLALAELRRRWELYQRAWPQLRRSGFLAAGGCLWGPVSSVSLERALKLDGMHNLEDCNQRAITLAAWS